MGTQSLKYRRIYDLSVITLFMLFMAFSSWMNYENGPVGGSNRLLSSFWGNPLKDGVFAVVIIFPRLAYMWLIYRLWQKRALHPTTKGTAFLVAAVVFLVALNWWIGDALDFPGQWTKAASDYSMLAFFLIPALSVRFRPTPLILALAAVLVLLYLKYPVEPASWPDYVTTDTWEEADAVRGTYCSFCNRIFELFLICSWALAHNVLGLEKPGLPQVVNIVVYVTILGVMVIKFPYSPFILLVPLMTSAFVYLRKLLFD